MEAWKSNLVPMGYTGSDPTGDQLGIKKSYQLLLENKRWNGQSLQKSVKLSISSQLLRDKELTLSCWPYRHYHLGPAFGKRYSCWPLDSFYKWFVINYHHKQPEIKKQIISINSIKTHLINEKWINFYSLENKTIFV